ncbi:MAG: pre-toxin TG domain-containing protein [Candidatus Paceibacterota bacterium]|jgi:hypothetical protein
MSKELGEIENLHERNEKEIAKKADEYSHIQELKNNKEEMEIEDEKYLLDKKKKSKQTKRTVAGFIPFLGSGMDLKEAKSGKEYFTGKKLTGKERVVKGVFGAGGMALDVMTFGADRVVVGAGERAAEVGIEKAAQSEARNVAERQTAKNIERRDKKLFNKESFNLRKLPSKLGKIGRFDIKDWLEKKKKLNKNRDMFANIWPSDKKKEEKEEKEE